MIVEKRLCVTLQNTLFKFLWKAISFEKYATFGNDIILPLFCFNITSIHQIFHVHIHCALTL